MTYTDDLIEDFNQVLKYGEQIRIKYYNQFSVGEYDDDIKLVQSGNDVWTSGLLQPLDSRQGSNDSILLEQGKILLDDRKAYVVGTITTSGLSQIKIGTNGSPTTREYQVLNDGQVISWEVNGSPVYKKLYIRYLNNGSFIGE